MTLNTTMNKMPDTAHTPNVDVTTHIGSASLAYGFQLFGNVEEFGQVPKGCYQSMRPVTEA